MGVLQRVQRLLRPLGLDCAGPEVPTVKALCGPVTSEHFRGYNPASQHPSVSPAAIVPAGGGGFPTMSCEKPLRLVTLSFLHLFFIFIVICTNQEHQEWTCNQGHGEHQLGIYHLHGYAFNDLDLQPQLPLYTFYRPQLADIVTGPCGGFCLSVIPELFNVGIAIFV